MRTPFDRFAKEAWSAILERAASIWGLLRGDIVAARGMRGWLRGVTAAPSRACERFGSPLLIVECTREWLPTSIARAA